VPQKAASGAKQVPVAACDRGIHLTLHLAPQTCVADAVKQAESLAAENVELRRMGEDALLDKYALRYHRADSTIFGRRSNVSGRLVAAQSPEPSAAYCRMLRSSHGHLLRIAQCCGLRRVVAVALEWDQTRTLRPARQISRSRLMPAASVMTDSKASGPCSAQAAAARAERDGEAGRGGGELQAGPAAPARRRCRARGGGAQGPPQGVGLRQRECASEAFYYVIASPASMRVSLLSATNVRRADCVDLYF